MPANINSDVVFDPQHWAQESFKMAPSAYEGATQHEKLSEE